MMQTVLVVLFIAAALFYLGMRCYRTWMGRRQKGCEKCGIAESKSSTVPERKTIR